MVLICFDCTIAIYIMMMMMISIAVICCSANHVLDHGAVLPSSKGILFSKCAKLRATTGWWVLVRFLLTVVYDVSDVWSFQTHHKRLNRCPDRKSFRVHIG